MNNEYFKKTHEEDINKLNREEARGWIINNMNFIENKIDNEIINFIKPQNSKAFKKILLNSSVISIGAKLKILRNIKDFNKNIISKIQLMSSIRNSFAHIPILPVFKWEKIDGEISSTRLPDTLEVMNSSGEIKSKNAKDELHNFNELKNEVNEYFMRNSNK
jgi:hypothetical protein